MNQEKSKTEFEPVLVAVYGTLKRGEGNNRVMEESEFLGEVDTAPEFTLYSWGGFPALVPEGETSVKCEIFRVNDPGTLQRIYRLEGYNGIRGHASNTFYDTMDIPTPWGDAEVFIQDASQNEGHSVIESGNFVGRRRNF